MVSIKVFRDCRQEASSQPRYHSALSNFSNITHRRHTEAVKTQGWCARCFTDRLTSPRCARCFTDRLTSPQAEPAANTEQASAVVEEVRLTRHVIRYILGWREPTVWGAKWASRRSQWKFIIGVTISFVVCLCLNIICRQALKKLLWCVIMESARRKCGYVLKLIKPGQRQNAFYVRPI